MEFKVLHWPCLGLSGFETGHKGRQLKGPEDQAAQKQWWFVNTLSPGTSGEISSSQ